MMLKNALFCLKKLRLRHFCRECRENLNIRVLRTKFWVKSACEDDPQVVPACLLVNIKIHQNIIIIMDIIVIILAIIILVIITRLAQLAGRPHKLT